MKQGGVNFRSGRNKWVVHPHVTRSMLGTIVHPFNFPLVRGVTNGRRRMAALRHQEAMEVDGDEAQCTPEEVLRIFADNDLNCNLRVLGNQLGLKPFDLNSISLFERSCPYVELLGRILHECWNKELLSWMNIVSVLRKPALKQYRIANRICRKHNLTDTSRSGSGGSSSMQSSGSISLESSLITVDPDAGMQMST